MNLIDTVSDQANQLIGVVLDDGTVVQLQLIYQGATERWTIGVAREDFVVNGIGICAFLNIMREWRDIIPFGIACLSTDGVDPLFIDDFVNGRCSLYILNQADVEAVEVVIAGS